MSLTESNLLASKGEGHPLPTALPRASTEASSQYSFGLLQAFFSEGEKGEVPAVLSRLAAKVKGAKNLSSAVAGLDDGDRKELEKKVGAAQLSEIVSLSQETDPSLYWQEATRMAQRLVQKDELRSAGALYSLIAQGGEAVPADIKAKAQQELDAIAGKGAFGARVEFLSRQFAKQATDLKVIAPMVLGSTVFQLTRTAVLGRLAATAEASWLTRGFGARFTAGLAGFAAEVPTFSMGSRLITSVSEGGVSWDGQSVGKDLLGATLTLGALKAFGYMGNQGFLKLHGIGELEASNLTKFQQFSQHVFTQGSVFTGMLASHRLEEMAGLRPHVEGSTAITDTLSSMVSMGIGGHLGNKLLGRNFAVFQQEMGIRANIYTQAGFGKVLSEIPGLRPSLAVAGGMPPALAMSMIENGEGPQGASPSPVAMMLGALGEGSGLSRRALGGRYVVIGNRGEPAVRAVSEIKQLGATPVVFYSEADANSLHANMDGVIRLSLKGNTSNETYNNIPARMAALEKLMNERGISADSLLTWEGWGFKSEDSKLFELYEKMGIRAAGAASHLMEKMGNKISARELANRAGVRTVPGSGQLKGYEEALAFAKEVGFPIIVKGGDTGGGKGIRVAMTEADLKDAFESAQREAFSTSGSDVMFAEKYIPSMRHLEVQVIGDSKGNFKVVGVRDCTMQRNNQKVLEEDVSTFLPENLLVEAKQIGAKIMAQLRTEDSRGIGYEGPGTIELIWDRTDDRLYFMEMNTRLQVEHTVTEMVSRQNLLREQLLIGAGNELSFSEIQHQGHAIEARITSENPYDGFKPSTGRILHMKLPESPKDGRSIVRVDSGVEEGREIPSYYDSMIAKLIVWAPNRAEAVAAMHKALGEFEILGVKTNIPFLRSLTDTEQFRSGTGYDTKFIEKVFLKSDAGKPQYQDKDEAIVAAAVQTYLKNPSIHQKVQLKFGDQEYKLEVYQTGPGRFLVKNGNASTEVGLSQSTDHLFSLEIGGKNHRTLIHGEPGHREVLIGGVSYEINVDGEGALGAEYVKSPSPAAILKILKEVGDEVKVGDPVVITEAMKMETALGAEMDGTVEEVFVKPGQQVDKGKGLVKLRPAGSAKAEGETKAGASTAWELPASLFQTLGEKNGSTQEQRRQALDCYSRFFEGYTAPVADLRGILSDVEPVSLAEPDYNQAVETWVQGLLQRYQTVEAVFQPAYKRQLEQFSKTGKVQDTRFEGLLKNALKLYGVDSLDPSPARDTAMRLLYQSHGQSEAKRELLGTVLAWVPKYEMNSLRDSLAGVKRVFSDSSQNPFLNQVDMTLARLQEKGDDREDLRALEEEFGKISGMSRSERDKASRRLLGRTEVILPFLLDKVASKNNRKAAHWALKLIQQRLYRNFFAFSRQQDLPAERMAITRMEPKLGKGGRPFLAVLRQAGSVQELELDLDRCVQQLKIHRKKSSSPLDGVIELAFPQRPSPEELLKISAIASRKLAGQNVSRFTLILADSEGGDVDYVTYEPNAAGVFAENALLRDIHPLHAQTLGLPRWTENFDLERQDFGLFHNVHAYRATEKGKGTADAKADRRHFVIGEYTGKLGYERFDGDRVSNRLLQDFRLFRSGALTGFSPESRQIWQWLPLALRETGQLGKDFDPFTVGVLAASPVEMIQQFQLDEAKLAKAAAFYEGKIFSVPEAERTAGNTAMVMRRLQESYVNSEGEVQKLPALADIFFRHPVELSDEEIKLLAFRLTPQFMGQQLEKTTLHFTRRNGQGAMENLIAEVKIPRGSRFEVTIKPALDAPSHAVKSPLEHKRVQQQGRGKLYVYDRVQLFQDVIKDFYPQGNLPEDAVQIQELALDKSGALNPVVRQIGQNDVGKVAFHVTLKTPNGEPGNYTTKDFAVIADDYTFQAGSQGTKEGNVYKALSRYAEEKGIPKLYLAETSGARLGLAEEVAPFVIRDDKLGINYVRAADLETPTGKKKKPLKDLVVLGEPFEVTRLNGEASQTETCYPLVAILGENEINSESLNASGKTGESESRARSQVPTFAISMGTVIGIGTYDTRLAERVIMVADSFLGLTGRKAINQTFGLKLKDELEVAGPEIMKENGVAYKVVSGERDAMKAFLQWLSYLPAKVGGTAPIVASADPIDRDITPGLISGENPLIVKGRAYDTRRFDEALFDRGSVFYVRENYGRAVNVGYARLGGKPVGLITMQLAPEQIPGADPVMGGALDAAASFKVAQHLDNLNLEGLPVLFNASISGFMPRPEDHLKGVVPGGAKILDSLRVFAQPAIIYVPPFGQLWGGAWVVVDKNINPNIVMVADHSAAMGILGSAGAISVPKNERAMEADLGRHPEIAALRKKRDAVSGSEREAIDLALKQAEETLRVQHYLPKWREFLDRQNTAVRAHRVGSIHEIIEDTAKTRPELNRILLEKSAAIRAEREQEAARSAERAQISGALHLMGIPHEWSPNGWVTLTLPDSKMSVPGASLLQSLQSLLRGQVQRWSFLNLFTAGLLVGADPGTDKGK